MSQVKPIGDGAGLETDMNTKERGELSEAKVITKFIELGYTVSTPFSENSRYDAIVDDGEELYRVQIKTGRYDDGSVKFSTCDTRSNTSENKKKYYSEKDIDAFAVYNPDLESFYWIDICEAPSNSMHLRVDDPESKFAAESKMNWASDFVLSDK